MLKCGLWHQVMFDVVFRHLGKNWVPSKCQQCFKVVVRPKTLRQLFALLELQKRLNRPCKCGIERRETVHGLYGGYFYNWGLHEGRKCYDIVRQAVDEDKELGPDVPVLLKRACTEYELKCGDSDKWTVEPEQLEVEAQLERWLVDDDYEHRQAEKLVHNVHRKWIEWAFANGDKTFADFTDGEPLYPEYITYQHLTHEEIENS